MIKCSMWRKGQWSKIQQGHNLEKHWIHVNTAPTDCYSLLCDGMPIAMNCWMLRSLLSLVRTLSMKGHLLTAERK